MAKGENIFDDANLGQIAALRRRCFETVSTDWENGQVACNQTQDYIDEIAGGLFARDGTQFESDWSPN